MEAPRILVSTHPPGKGGPRTEDRIRRNALEIENRSPGERGGGSTPKEKRSIATGGGFQGKKEGR